MASSSSRTQSPQRGTGRGIGIRTAAGSDERVHGQLHVYDGDGKGKSQAALGVVLRTIGLGICERRRTRVLLLRFLKGPGRSYDEDAAIEALQQGFPHLIDQVRTGRGEYFSAEQASRFDRQEAQRGWDIAKGAIASALYSVVVLDELNPVLDLGLLDTAEVVRTLAAKPEGMEVICTGRGAPAQLVQLADLHSEMRAHRRRSPDQRAAGSDPDGALADRGLDGIEIYTGEGKGKSTSALGKALQAIGRHQPGQKPQGADPAVAQGRQRLHRRRRDRGPAGELSPPRRSPALRSRRHRLARAAAAHRLRGG
jgi:cob(I)alamin adenosyltransferase